MCGVPRESCDREFNPPLEGAMPPSVTVGTQPAKPEDHSGMITDSSGASSKGDIPTIDLSQDDGDDLQKAIKLSLQEQQQVEAAGAAAAMLLPGISTEDRAVSEALEASLRDAQPSQAEKHLSPLDLQREQGTPVGLRNIGNSCWFNVVIQPLFHIPQFRNMILEFPASMEYDDDAERGKMYRRLVPELRKLFASMVGSDRKYIDPTEAISIFTDAHMIRNLQQDMCEFTHKLLEKLEEDYRELSDHEGFEKETSSGSSMGFLPRHENDTHFDNRVMDLFYGRTKKEGGEGTEGDDSKEIIDDNSLKEETFGQYPLQITNFKDIHESILASMSTGLPYDSQGMVEPVRQDTWFKTLPPILIFSLSRFEYSLQRQRAEKVHNKFEFTDILYMDRYMEVNKKLIQEKHLKVANLKTQLNGLLKVLEGYERYGSGQAKYPIGDILKYTLEFVQTGRILAEGRLVEDVIASPMRMDVDAGLVEDREIEVEMLEEEEASCPHAFLRCSPAQIGGGRGIMEGCHSSITIDNSTRENMVDWSCPSGQTVGEAELEDCLSSPCKKMRLLPPVPQHISPDEFSVLHSCLQRWSADVDAQVSELRSRVHVLRAELSKMYDEVHLRMFSYKLHAVVVHEGQASGGHYWVFVFDAPQNRWVKFNDVQVVPSSWEEMLQDSIGGQNNASAYCLFYTDQNRQSFLFPPCDETFGDEAGMMGRMAVDLQEQVKSDNATFRREITEWEAQQQAEAEKGTKDASGTEKTSSGSNDGSPDVICMDGDDISDPLLELESFTVTMVKEKFSKFMVERTNLEKSLPEFVDHIFTRMTDFQNSQTGFQKDTRIMDLGLYLLQNNQSQKMIYLSIVEVLHGLIGELSEGQSPEVSKLQLEVVQKSLDSLREPNLVKSFQAWKHQYLLFLDCTQFLVFGSDMFQKNKWDAALPILLRAYLLHNQLEKCHPLGPKKTVDRRILWHYFSQCLYTANKVLIKFFMQKSDIQQLKDYSNYMFEIFLPAVHALDNTREEDKDMQIRVRSEWCQLLDVNIPDEMTITVQTIIEDILGGENEIPVRPPGLARIQRVLSALSLYQRYEHVCEVVIQATKPQVQPQQAAQTQRSSDL